MSHLVLRKWPPWRAPHFQGRVLGASLRSVPLTRGGQDVGTEGGGAGGAVPHSLGLQAEQTLRACVSSSPLTPPGPGCQQAPAQPLLLALQVLSLPRPAEAVRGLCVQAGQRQGAARETRALPPVASPAPQGRAWAAALQTEEGLAARLASPGEGGHLLIWVLGTGVSWTVTAPTPRKLAASPAFLEPPLWPDGRFGMRWRHVRRPRPRAPGCSVCQGLKHRLLPSVGPPGGGKSGGFLTAVATDPAQLFSATAGQRRPGGRPGALAGAPEVACGPLPGGALQRPCLRPAGHDASREPPAPPARPPPLSRISRGPLHGAGTTRPEGSAW